jgi:hypothetical protein
MMSKSRQAALSAVIVASSLMASGCDKVQATICSPAGAIAAATLDLPPAPPVLRDTPDHALRSFWATRDAVAARVYALNLRTNQMYREAQAPLAPYLDDRIESAFISDPYVPEKYAREIIEVDQQTDSRAVIVAVIRNVTPIPEGATPLDFQTKARKQGDRYRYLLNRDAGGWYIEGSARWIDYDNKWSDYGPSMEADVPWLTHAGT